MEEPRLSDNEKRRHFSALLKKRRKKLKISSLKMALSLRCDRSTIYRWENSPSSSPEENRLTSIAKAYRLPIEALRSVHIPGKRGPRPGRAHSPDQKKAEPTDLRDYIVTTEDLEMAISVARTLGSDRERMLRVLRIVHEEEDLDLLLKTAAVFGPIPLSKLRKLLSIVRGISEK